MTREEAIEWLVQIQDKYIHDGDEQFDAKRKEALNMAIDALERTDTHECVDPTHECVDLISRNAALALVVKAIHGTDSEEIKDYLFGGLRKELWALPSAQPERKKGKWIPYSLEGLRYKCSECESKYETPWHFCPNCGSYNGGESDDKG